MNKKRPPETSLSLGDLIGGALALNHQDNFRELLILQIFSFLVGWLMYLRPESPVTSHEP